MEQIHTDELISTYRAQKVMEDMQRVQNFVAGKEGHIDTLC
jgi:hypothetical protein